MENKFTFPLTFTEALEVLKSNSGWVQGEDFMSGIVMTNISGYFKCKDFTHNEIFVPHIGVSMMDQKYRIVHFESELK